MGSVRAARRADVWPGSHIAAIRSGPASGFRRASTRSRCLLVLTHRRPDREVIGSIRCHRTMSHPQPAEPRPAAMAVRANGASGVSHSMRAGCVIGACRGAQTSEVGRHEGMHWSCFVVVTASPDTGSTGSTRSYSSSVRSIIEMIRSTRSPDRMTTSFACEASIIRSHALDVLTSGLNRRFASASTA